jgi:Protein of unknown function (DUF2917)
MRQIEHFELTTPVAVALRLAGGCIFRVTYGQVWLTLQGRLEDIWLQAGASWTLPVAGTVWVSADSVARFQLLRAIRLKTRFGFVVRWRTHQSRPLCAGSD